VQCVKNVMVSKICFGIYRHDLCSNLSVTFKDFFGENSGFIK